MEAREIEVRKGEGERRHEKGEARKGKRRKGWEKRELYVINQIFLLS